MKINFRKVSAIATSALLVGMTMGTAMAATYPAPFVSSGSPNVAIVYGASADALDATQATNIQTELAKLVTTTGGQVSVTGGEEFKLEKTNDPFYLGESFADAYSATIDSEDLAFLADGTYRDGDINSDYTQEITLGDTATLSYFKDSTYNNNEPTLGFAFANNENVLTYTLTFEDDVNATEMENTDMPLFGGEYYVLTATTSQLVLLDSANKQTLELGASATVGGKDVTVTYIGSDKVKFTVDGVTLPSLGEGDDYELKDGSYIVVTDVMASSKDSVTDSVEFSIGKGKITMNSGDEIEMGDTTINGLTATLTNTTNDIIDSIAFAWTSYRKTFLTEGNPIVMPGFETFQFTFDGLAFPEESEAIALDSSDVLTLSMGNFDLELLAYNSSDNTHVVGGNEDNLLKLSADYAAQNATQANGTGGVGYNVIDSSFATLQNATGWYLDAGLSVIDGDRFILTTYATGDEMSDITQAYYEVDGITYTDASNYKVVLKDLTGDGNDLEFTSLRDRTKGDITVNLAAVGKDANSEGIAYLVFDGYTTTDVALSKEGLYADLSDLADGFNDSTDRLTFSETDDDVKLNAGIAFTVTLANNTDDDAYEVSTTNVSTQYSPSNKDVKVGYVTSALATKVTLDESADENDFAIEYYGVAVPATVKLVAGGSVETSGDSASPLGDIIVKDTEVESVKAKNLIVVGGSCVNTVAAGLLGTSGAACGADFTAKAGVGAGQFLIKSYTSPYSSSKIALLVAGYERDDTKSAVTYLNSHDLDVGVGKSYPMDSITYTAVGPQ